MEKIILTGIGADVELFLKNKVSGEIVSAEGLIKGTKEEPFIFDPENKYFATSLDNVLAELCIPPAINSVQFHNYLRKSRQFIESTLPKELCTAALPAARLDDKYLQTEQALIFGCEPDYSAYTGQINYKPSCDDFNLRSAGGHLHLGYENPEPFEIDVYLGDIQRCNIIKALDLHLAVPSVILEPDNQRKELYGKAGAFRPKPYGVEYRTISNFYMDSRKATMWVFNQVKEAINWLNSGNIIDDNLGYHIQAVVNGNNKTEAENLIKQFNLKMV